jgi:hypothetical protein
MAESEYGGLGLSIVVVVRRYVIFKTKIEGGVRYEVKLFIPIVKRKTVRIVQRRSSVCYYGNEIKCSMKAKGYCTDRQTDSFPTRTVVHRIS